MSSRLTRALLATISLGSSGLLFSACGGTSADAYAHQACLDVHRSILLFDKSQSTADAHQRAKLGAEALSTLRQALQPAAAAGGGGGEWEALEMTLSESNRVAESTLIPALSAQCATSLQSN